MAPDVRFGKVVRLGLKGGFLLCFQGMGTLPEVLVSSGKVGVFCVKVVIVGVLFGLFLAEFFHVDQAYVVGCSILVRVG